VATGSIDSREIANDTVQSRDLRDGAVQARDVKDRSLTGRDVANGRLSGADLKNDSVGRADVAPQAVQSPEITNRSIFGRDVASNALGDREINEPQLDVGRLDGFPGSRYVRNVQSVQTGTANNAAPLKSTPAARCPRRKRVIGGGAKVLAATPVPVALSANGPSGNGWAASAYATAGTGN
jgi:hypothetical protein